MFSENNTDSRTARRQKGLRVLVMILGAFGVAMAINQQFLLNMLDFSRLGMLISTT